MNRYFRIYLVVLKQYAAYRLNFVLWRVRSVISTLIMIFLWSGVFDTQRSFGSYSKERLLSYILFGSLVSTLIASTRVTGLAQEIQSGDLMNTLLRPLSVFGQYAAGDAADKTMNILFGGVEFFLIISLLALPLAAPQSPLLFLFFLICGLSISFFVNLMLSCIGFWTPDVWAPRFLFMMLVTFLSGAYFPLDLLPPLAYRIVLLTPFPYFSFLPTKILVDGAQNPYILQQLLAAVFWVGGTGVGAQLMWKKGVKDFAFWGK